MKKYLLLATASIFAFAACKKNDSSTPVNNGPTARVMFINAIVSPDSAKVKINDTVQQSIGSIAFSTNTGYNVIRAGGSTKFTFYSPLTGVDLLSSNQNVIDKNNYSFFIAGDAVSKTALYINDDLTAPSSGNAKIRFINLSPTGFGAKVIMDNVAVDSNVTYLGLSGFREVNAKNYSIKMGDPGTFTFGSIASQDLQAGKIYTFILTGTTTGSGNFGLKLSAIANN